MSPAPSGPDGWPDCWSCSGFFVTHEASLPYGCRMFAIKTRLLPRIEVERTSGAPCQAFVPRAALPASQSPQSPQSSDRARPR